MEEILISLEEFLRLPTEEVAKLVRASGSKVVVFPINGTRRWFALEYGSESFDDPIKAYMDISGKRHVELYKLFFDHGVDTLLTPVIGPEILATRDAYMQKVGGEGLARLVTHPEFVSFYDEYDVRVRFYGEYHANLAHTPYEYLSDLFDGIAQQTSQHKRFRLFFGAFADNLNSTQVAANYAIESYKKHGMIPDRKAIVEMYYGEYIEKADVFIGFDRLAAFDYPFLNSGGEDLYFTAAPSMYMNAAQLRNILYDCIYTRRALDPDYGDFSPGELQDLRNFYVQSHEYTLGTGELLHGIWTPSLK